jgi:hypothetical protein
MSVEFYDLALRMRAAQEHRPLPRAYYAPVSVPRRPIAVQITGARDGAHFCAATDADTVAVIGRLTPEAVLSGLRSLGVDLQDDEPRTLLVPTLATLRRLSRLARGMDGRSPLAEQAAVIGWWEQRHQHLGTAAVLALPEVCARRWVLGVHPDHERAVQPWVRWLSIPGRGPAALLQLAERAAEGSPLPGLEHYTEDDQWSWTALARRVAGGRPWHSPDTPAEAAIGLAGRCDAADLYTSLRLADPLVAAREVHTGNVITARITAMTRRGQLTLTSHQPMCRLRPETEVQGWIGEAWQAPLPGDPTSVRLRGARLSAVSIDATRTLTLTLAGARFSATPQLGTAVSLRARAVDPHQQRHGRRNLSSLYRRPDNWLRGRPRRPWNQPVPLDVAIAAAD